MKIKLLLSLLVITSLVSCRKDPNASFTTNKNIYTAGETIYLQNTSNDADFYRWILPDGRISNSVNVNYQTDPDFPGGGMIFKLEAYSRNGKRMDVASKVVTVLSASVPTGDVVFWQATGSGFDVTDVTIGASTASITLDMTAEPACGTPGNANFYDLPSGIYSYSATDGTYNWTGTVEVAAGYCSPVQLQ